MKCNKDTGLLCTSWENCKQARNCDNVPKVIRDELKAKRKVKSHNKKKKN